LRVVVLCNDPERALRDPESVICALGDLGCRVSAGRFDFGGLDEEELLRHPPAILIVDAGDELDRGFQALRKRNHTPPLGDVPVLLTTTVPRLPSLDFSAGFDDFLLSPIVPAELYARLRQLDWSNASFSSDEVIKIDELVIDVSGYEVRAKGRTIDFTHLEFELLRFLAQSRGRVFTREHLLQKVWGYDYCGGTRTVDIHIRRIRSKLGPGLDALIQTVRNVGYKLRGAEALEDQ